MIIIHHNDLDGRCGAAIVGLKYPDADFIEMDYRKPFPFDHIVSSDELTIVDFSPRNDEEWEKLKRWDNKIFWLDHHETALRKAPEWALKLSGRRNTEECGALLAFNYFFPDTYPPLAVRLIDKWDRHIHDENPDVLDFVYGLKIEDTSPEKGLWKHILFPYEDELSPPHIEYIQHAGKIIRFYQEIEDRKALKACSYLTTWEGHRCRVIHIAANGSRLIEQVKDQQEIMVVINFDGKVYTAHLYSDTVKVNDIAVKYGGGGHPGAAGFVCKSLPPELACSELVRTDAV